MYVTTFKTVEEHTLLLNKKIAQLTLASYMSNSKWFKTFKVLSKHSICLDFKYLDSEYIHELNSAIEISNHLHSEGIGDCISGGPCLFKQLEFVKIRKRQSLKVALNDLELQQIYQDLQNLGELMLTLDDDGITINGYLMKS